MNRTNKRNLTVVGNKTKSLRNPLINSNIITTPYEKVLSILVNIKRFISNIIQDKYNYVKDIDWCIKVITSHSLYSYELKDKDTINHLSKNNHELKELVDFVSEYNENIIKMNRKYNHIFSDHLLQKSSIKLNRRKIERKSTFWENESYLLKVMKSELINDGKLNSESKDNSSSKKMKKVGILSENDKKNYLKLGSNKISDDGNHKNKKLVKINEDKKINLNSNDEIKSYNSKDSNNNQKIHKKSILKNKKIVSQNSLNNDNSMDELSYNKTFSLKEKEDEKDNEILDKDTAELLNKNRRCNSINAKQSVITNQKNKSSDKIIKLSKEYSFYKIQNILLSENYDISKLITSRNFNIFQLESLIGYNNVLPVAGRIILENLGLLDEGILNQEKLDNFLVSVNSQYKQQTLYHNSLHGTDVTQSSYIFFTHSNAEKIAKTNVIDLLSIIIAALGHDLGHPGLTNMFHMNDFTDIAITYNDISILENFHASLLFKTLRKTENNIFEKLSNIDYKIIRKRMISEILATDMANHGKVVSVIKSKISLNDNNEYRLNLLSGNEQTKIEEQQYLLDFMLHLADLAHNTKLFNISLKWVELLSEEFWRQGDLEKEKNLPVSFLCDREKVNIPQSQKGFISGFILPTFESLVSIFPSLKFTLDNANNNLNEWQKLLDEGRLTGWTPKKNKKEKKRRVRISIKEKEKDKENESISEKNNDFINDKEKKKEEQKVDENNINNNINIENKKDDDILQTNIIEKKTSKKNSTKINHNFFKDKMNDIKTNNNSVLGKNTIFMKPKQNISVNNSANNLNKIINIENWKEKGGNSSKEIRRINKYIIPKNNKKMKIAILDDMSFSSDEDNEHKKDENLSYLTKNNLENQKNKNILKFKK